MNRKTKKLLKRNARTKLTGVLACALTLSTVGTVVAASLDRDIVKKINAEAITNSSGKKTVNIDGVTIALDQELNDNGDGTYSLTLKSSSNLKYEDLSVKMTKVKNGYYKAEQSGRYMIELFGGNGGDGQDTIYSKGGKGGAGGHMYAVAELKAGDILYYTIGGNGQKTLSNDSGGGANGDGGDHGDTGSYYVGGGGGYTALYKFGVDDTDGKDANHFINTYLDAEGNLKDVAFQKADRITKYIMVAGGGGGGGAGNAFSLTDKAVRAPDGGNAGNFGIGKGTLDDGFAVPGTLYAGQNGFSSGKNQSYIGKGGTEKPGEINSTFVSWFAGKEPNDWAGSQNSKYPGGSGGAGNLRGGAGGAGFAGGSGGVMTGLLIGTNVGGGGGGSSFIASSLTEPLADDAAYIVNNNESTVGGAVYITYMPTEDDFNYLANLGLSGDISKYFDVVDYSASNSDGSTATVDITNGHITSSGLKATPSTETATGAYSTINIKLKPKAGFMGGNDVPVYASDKLSFTYTKSAVTKSVDIGLVEKCSFVNVPYAFELNTHSYTKNGSPEEPNKELHVYDLFEDKGYVLAKQSSSFEYDFIDAVTDYQITSEGGSYGKNDLLTLTASKSFDISFKVTPKAGSKAIVGEKLTTKTYTKKAKVTLVAASKNSLNGNEIQYQKTLNYDPATGYYTLALNAKADIPSITPPATITTNKYTYNSSKTGSYTAPEEGYYFVQLWGGKGGNGGNAAGDGNKGGAGGEPGYVGELIRLNKDDVIDYSIGNNGSNGAKGTFVSRGEGGQPGYGTYIKVNSVAVLAAAGSGGGGGALWTSSGSGVNADPVSSTYNTGTFDASSINGGEPPTGIVNRNPGTSGTNYKSAAYYSAHPLEGAIDESGYKKSDYTNSNGGAFYITYVGVKSNYEHLSDYSVEADFTDDFELVTSTLSGATGNSGTAYITDIDPTVSHTGTRYSFDFTASFILKPADSCLGGVDIKLLDNLYIRQADFDGIMTNDEIECDPQDPTDYANVRILPSLLDQFSLTTHDVNYIAGDTPINSSNLYTASTSFVPTDDLQIKYASEGLPATVSPDQTTDYSISYGIKSTKEAEKAVVGPNIEPVVTQLNSRVTVYNEVTYDLTNMSVEAPVTNIDGADHYTFVPGEDYSAVFTAGTGMELPDNIEVEVDGVPFTNFEYVTKSVDEKSLTIEGEDLVGAKTLKITAAAKERTFKLHYLVSLDASGTVTKDYVVDVKAGYGSEPEDDFDSILSELLAQHTDIKNYEGYTYTIEYPDGTPLTEMPAYDVWINGCYHPNPRNLTIHYVDELYQPIGIDDYVDTDETCYYRKDIDVISPEQTGYAPLKVMKDNGGSYTETTYNPARLQFVMPDADLELYVLYKDISSSVVINFECKDPEVKLPATICQSGVVGNAYSFSIPEIDGYVSSVSEVSGQYKVEGESFVVTYTPKTYTISFDPGYPGADPIESRTVFYNHEIGYTGESYEEAVFNPLPTPIRVGYNFKGWFLNGFIVTGLDTYTLEGDGTLVAMWEQSVITVTEDNCIVNFDPEELEYNGLEQHPGVTVSVNGATLVEGTDFDVTWPLESTVVGSKDVIIRFKGAYKGEVNASYSIIGKNIPSDKLEVEDISGEYTFTGEEIKPTPYVRDNGAELVCGQDYYYEYKNNIDKTDPSKPTQVIVHFMGNYANTPDYTENFTIIAKNATEGSGYITVDGITDPVTYTGEPIKPSPLIVTYCDGLGGETILVEGKDFIVDYGTNTDAGTGTVTIKFINNYANTPDEVKTFTIKPITTDLDLVSWEDLEPSYLYDGTEQEPTPTIFYGEGLDKVELVEGVDYTLTYDDNIDVNSDTNHPTIHVNFMGNYDGVKDIDFTIKPRVLSDLGEEFDVSPTSDPSNPIKVLDTQPAQQIPLVIVDDEGNVLEEGKDFDIVDGSEPGEKEVVFKGDYEGNDPVTIYVELTGPSIDELLDEYDYTGGYVEPKPEITFGDDVLEEGVDYILTYEDNKEPGEAKIIITYISVPYSDLIENPKTLTFNIVATEIIPGLLDIDEVDPVTYDGTAHHPTPAVYYNGVLLTVDVDYTYSYGENIHAGEGAGKVTINFIGGFSGNKVNVYFDILAKEIEDPTDPDEGLIIEPLPDESDPMQVPNNGKDPVDFGPITITDPETGEELRNPEDFTLVDDGDGDGHIEFHGDYEGTPDVPFKYVLTDPEITSTIADQPYTGEPIEPEVTVEFDGETLTEGVDYIVRYEDNDEVGEAKVIVEFIGDYEGCPDKELPFNIVQSTIDPDPSKLVIGEIADQPFTGFQITPEPSVTYNGVVLTAGKDYTYNYGENVHAGTDAGSVTISFIGGFTGEDVDKTFNILPKQVEDPTNPDTGLTITPVPDQDNPIKVPPTSGDPKLPITITDPETGEELRNPEDFTIEFDPDTGEAHIEFHGDYEGTPDVDVFYEVEEIVIDPIDDQEYTGEQSTPVPHITFNGEDLVEGEDYIIEYGDNDETGEGTITITYIGEFADVTPNPDTITFNIVKNNIDAHDLVVDYIDPMTYTGSQLIPDNVVVKYNGVVLTEDVDYELSYGENIHAGEGNGKVIISMIGGFESENTKTVYFDILPKEVEDPSDPDTGLIIEPLPDESDPMQIPNNGKDPIEFEEIVITDPVTGEELRNPEDFTLVDDGDGDGHIEFHGDYEGTPDVPFKYEIVDPEITTTIEDQPYTGEPIEPEITVTFDGEELEEGVDYIVRYEDNDEVGEAKVIVEFIGDYEGCEDQEITFNIVPTTIDESLVDVADVEDQTYTGSQIKPTPEVKYNGVVLTAGKDFKYNYGENVHAGEDVGTVTIEFIGGFEGDDVEKTFNITPKQITDPDDPDTGLDIDPRPTKEDPIVVPDKGDGSEPDLMPIEIKDKETGETLTNPEDFEIVIDDEEGHAHIEFKGDYEGTPDIPLFYEVQEVKVNIPTQPFSGGEVKPHPEVTFAGETLTEGVDYVVYYGNNTQPGTGKAIIQFIGEFADVQTRTVEFDIKGTRLDNSATNADGRSTVVVVNDEGFDPDITLYAKLVEDVPQDIKDQAALGGRFYGTYGDYEIKLFDKDGNEVQPSDIKEGTVLTLMIQLPEELQGRDVKLVHYHSADDISVIVKGDEAGIGTYVITEEGYIVTQINKFSNFSLIYEETCLAHWFMITAAVLNVLLVAAVIIMGKKQSKALGIGAIVGLAVMSGVGAIFAHCMICWVMLGINGAMILFDILFFCLWKGKEEPQAPQAEPQVVYVQQPAPQQVVVQQVVAPTPVAAPVDGLSLKASIIKAASVNSVFVVTKELVANYLTNNYNDVVELNRKPNYTSTNLPLADTHYVKLIDKKACFIYVYELKNNKSFFIVRTTDEIANQIKEKHLLVEVSAFPRTNDGAKWYTLMFDESYRCAEDVYEVIDLVIKGFVGECAPAPVVEEPAKELSLKESMAKAAEIVSELKVNKELVANYLTEKHPDNVEVNRKPNFTKTGLPLADTHYVLFGENMRKCFMYVYEVNEEAFFIVRTTDEVYNAIKAKHPLVAPSAFPATKDGGKWFTVMFDSSFKSNDDVYEVIEMVLNSYDHYEPVHKEPEPVKVEEPVVEPAPVVEESEEGIAYKYNFSFSARLIRAGDDRQNFYNAIKNHALSYKKVASKISWGHELIKLGRIKICELKVKGKTLCVYLPLDPDKYDKERMFYQDMRTPGKEVEFPMMLKVKSDRGVKYACELIDEVMRLNNIPHNDNYEEADYRLPYMSIEEMLTSDPVLAKLTDGSEIPHVEKKPEPVKVEEPVVEPAPVVEEDEDSIAYKYIFSFSARLIRAGADRQDFYNAIKNHALSYKKVASKISWGHELIKLGRIKICELKVKGKTLCVYLPLDPDKYDKERMFYQDMRTPGKEVEFPMMLKVKSDRGVKYACELIDEVMALNEIPHNDNYEEKDYRLPEMSIEEMLTSDPVLAKLTVGSEMPISAPKKVEKPIEEVKVEPVPVEEAEEDSGFDYKYSFSFSARLIRAGADRQDLYNAIKNDILGYKKVASKISWGHELFKLGRIKLAQIKIKGKTLCVYLPLDPDKYDAERLYFKDMRVPGKEVEFPMMMKVKSDRAVKYVAELMADVMANNGIVRVEDYVEQDYRLPELSLEEMLKEGLAKDLTK